MRAYRISVRRKFSGTLRRRIAAKIVLSVLAASKSVSGDVFPLSETTQINFRHRWLLGTPPCIRLREHCSEWSRRGIFALCNIPCA